MRRRRKRTSHPISPSRGYCGTSGSAPPKFSPKTASTAFCSSRISATTLIPASSMAVPMSGPSTHLRSTRWLSFSAAQRPRPPSLRYGAAARGSILAGGLVRTGGAPIAALSRFARGLPCSLAGGPAASGPEGGYLGATRLPRRQSDVVGRPAGSPQLRASRFSGRGLRSSELRPRLSPRGRAAGCSGRAARGDERALSRGFSAKRSSGLFAFGGDPRGAAQLQDLGNIHPPVEARRQAPISRAYPADLAIARRGSRPPRSRSNPTMDRSPLAGRGTADPRHARRGMSTPPRSAMVLAAGLGTRLRPVTETIPKPLIEINGRTLLDHAIDRLSLVRVERIVINVHHKAEMVVTQLSRRDTPRIEISKEPELLDTGGGVKQALPLLGDAFFVVNSDVFWLNSKDDALLRLADGFDPDHMDAILLLQRTVTAVGYEGSGD